LGGQDQEDEGSRPAQTKSSRDPIYKITRPTWTGGTAQMVECLLWVRGT
jgi:hypothetical protein